MFFSEINLDQGQEVGFVKSAKRKPGFLHGQLAGRWSKARIRLNDDAAAAMGIAVGDFVFPQFIQVGDNVYPVLRKAANDTEKAAGVEVKEKMNISNSRLAQMIAKHVGCEVTQPFFDLGEKQYQSAKVWAMKLNDTKVEPRKFKKEKEAKVEAPADTQAKAKVEAPVVEAKVETPQVEKANVANAGFDPNEF